MYIYIYIYIYIHSHIIYTYIYIYSHIIYTYIYIYIYIYDLEIIKKQQRGPQNRMEYSKKLSPKTLDKKSCALCLEEKLEMLHQQQSLKQRKEVFFHCVHKEK